MRSIHGLMVRSAAALALILAPAHPPCAAEVRVIAHSDVGIDSLSGSELKRLFLGATSKVGARRVRPATLNEPEIHAVFLQAYVSRTPAQFTNHWRKIVFTGKGSLPRRFDDPREMIRFVAENEGAIGYIPGDTDVTDVAGIKVLVIDRD